MDGQTIALLDRAADDEATLHLEGLLEVPFGQHAQEAIEKLLKALINELGHSYPYTHDLDLLVRELEALGESLPSCPVPLSKLTDYALALRYEDTDDLPPPLDRGACLATVELLRLFVVGRFEALEPPAQ